MAQLKEDEWPADGEPTTTEREEQPRTHPREQEEARRREPDGRAVPEPTVPVTNTRPDEAVD